MAKKKKKNPLITVLSVILSFLLAVILTVGSVVIGVNVGFFSQNRIIDSLNYKDYYASVEKTFYQNAKDITTPIGLPEETVEGIVESDVIHEDVKNYVANAIEGKEYTFSTEQLKNNLEQNVRQYFSNEELTVTAEQEATIPAYTQMIAEEYEKTIKVPFVGRFAPIKTLLNKLMIVVCAACTLLAAVIILMLVKMQYWKHRGVRYIIYATLSSGIMVALPGIAGLVSRVYMRLNITADYLYYALTKYISNGLWVFIYLALMWAAVSFCLLFLIHYLKHRAK